MEEITRESELTQHELDLINHLLPELIISPDFVRHMDSSVAFAIEHHFSNRSWYDRAEAFKTRMDTTQFSIYLHDTLTTSILGKETLNKLPDSAFGGLDQQLKTATLTNRAIELERIVHPVPYKLTIDKPDWQGEEFEFLGQATFSRIAFNKDYTEALFYYKFSTRPESLGGYYVYANKVNDKWVIKELTDFDKIKITVPNRVDGPTSRS